VTLRATVKPELLRWARERLGRTEEDLSGRFKKLALWERGEALPTFKQLEDFAKSTHVPIGYLFLSKPPQERIPIPDLRTFADRRIERPSPDLLDTIYLCQQRQEWYRDFARKAGEPRREFVGSASVTDEVEETAGRMRDALGFEVDERRRIPTWTDALRRFIEQADRLGVLVMVSGVVGTNNRRKLDPKEFRGFALCDPLAPLVFINGSDSKAAQMFTLAHELAHVWLGQSALSNAEARTVPDNEVERWCNRVAAELLVPLAALREAHEPGAELPAELDRLARRFKVSTLVVLRRLRDLGGLAQAEYWDAYEAELNRLPKPRESGGGDFYLTQAVRAGRRFSRALIVSTFEGRSSFTEAFRLLGVRKVETLRRFGTELEIPL
jgi:Zn-dependent peptidase ImmA (M78 family)